MFKTKISSFKKKDFMNKINKKSIEITSIKFKYNQKVFENLIKNFYLYFSSKNLFNITLETRVAQIVYENLLFYILVVSKTKKI